MTNSQILKISRKLLPLLDGLLGAEAPAVKKTLRKLIARAAKGNKVAAKKILKLLTSYPAARRWLKVAFAQRAAPAKSLKGLGDGGNRFVRRRFGGGGVGGGGPFGGGATKDFSSKPAKTAKAKKQGHVSVSESGYTAAQKARWAKIVKGKAAGAKKCASLPIAVPHPTPHPPAAKPASAKAPDNVKHHVVTIHYATDRKRSGKTAPAKFFTGERAEKKEGVMSYGTCEVSIPARHKKGGLESPSWKKFEFFENPDKHVVLMRISPLDASSFFASAGKAGPQALVFVHGFNVTFEDGARRTAQIAYDLPFDGVPILYSWPSRGSKFAYTVDETSIQWTVSHLQQFLTDLITKSGIKTVHIIAHSMGNWAVTHALANIAQKNPANVKFHQVVLTAPDIDAQVFEDLAAQFLGAAERVTLYASADDVALKASKTVHKARRAGDATGGVLVVNKMDSVDATGVDTSFLGHSYIGSEKSVLTDVFYVLKGDPADQRKATLKKAASGAFYQFVL